MTHTKLTMAEHKAGLHKKSQKSLKPRAIDTLKKPEPEETEKQTKRKASRKFLFKKRCRNAYKQIMKDKLIYNRVSSIRQIVWSMFNTENSNQETRYRLRPQSVVIIHKVAAHIARNIMSDSKLATTVDSKTTLQGKRLKANMKIWSKYNDFGFYQDAMDLYKQICKPDDKLIEDKQEFEYV